MTASRQELQPVIDQLLDLLDIRMFRSGQVVLHFNGEGRYERASYTQYVPPRPDDGEVSNGNGLTRARP